MEQPGPGVGPPTFGSGLGDSEDFRGFFNFQADEITQLHQLRLLRLEFGETVERIVEREQLIVRCGAGDFEFLHVEMRGAPASPLTALASGPSDEDTPHCLGGGAEEMRAVLPRLVG